MFQKHSNETILLLFYLLKQIHIHLFNPNEQMLSERKVHLFITFQRDHGKVGNYADYLYFLLSIKTFFKFIIKQQKTTELSIVLTEFN